MGRKLYVGNLPYQTGETELTELFSRAGTVESARIMRDMATGRARGFGFVEMATDEEAQRAISELNEFQREGRALVVNEARPKPMGGGGGGFGGDRGGNRGGGGGGGGNRREPRWWAGGVREISREAKLRKSARAVRLGRDRPPVRAEEVRSVLLRSETS